MYFYRYKGKLLVSKVKDDRFDSIPMELASREKGEVYVLNTLDPSKSRRSFLITDPSLLFLESEGIDILKMTENKMTALPNWLNDKINCKKAVSVNTAYSSWEDVFLNSSKKKWKVNVAGLGDVGGILTLGLRLMGYDSISDIGIYDLSENKINRWLFELNQVLPPDNRSLPPVHNINGEDIFNCDLFVFCVSVGVPPVGEKIKDVRLVQLQGNSTIINSYAKKAREENFKGLFAVVSDPVDLLCKAAFISSNTNEIGEMDFNGLAPEQIRGYGLGVMNARASYYANLNQSTNTYKDEGRVYGPHGEGLIVANSILNYDNKLSIELTQKTKEANLEVRETGFKPYIAPAISSGSLSLIATIKSEWHYSSTFIGGIFMGARNRMTSLGTELERLTLPDELFHRIKRTYEQLGKML